MVVAYAEIEYDEDYLGPDSDLIGGMKVDKVTQCSLELCVLEHDVSVEDGTPEINTSVLDYGQLLWRNSPAHSTPTGETLCWQPTSGPQDITFGDYIRNDNSTYAQLGSVEYAFCGISYDIKLHESVFVGSMIRLHFRYPKGDGNQDAKPDGDPNTIRIGSVGLDTIMSNVAKQMNKEALRLNGSDVHGITHVTEVYVEVQWLWLILPIVLVVTGIIFVVMVIIDNKKNGTSLWKSSVLAFLYHGLHDVDKEGCMAVSVMERKAEELVVRLQASDDGNGGLILREQKDSV
ncbi:uncharacterized protein N7511_002354 [Penicillium nucicola]|uniref:uncharacterized protein n=1 Tax=Penicillium nucicola TaxID=1850975 RepID=UPI0025453D5F|nr:uncharacterized protein N7511_002354 [Penicillium nucicola]KAJ5770303.1 hypothetical protein N7511_002354 [Penicillium nucicola]